jgi:hypothetical protein
MVAVDNYRGGLASGAGLRLATTIAELHARGEPVLPKLSGTALDDAAPSDPSLRVEPVGDKSRSDKALDCYQHADRCARQAEQRRDPKLREDFHYLERGWLKLARSLEFAELRQHSERSSE